MLAAGNRGDCKLRDDMEIFADRLMSMESSIVCTIR